MKTLVLILIIWLVSFVGIFIGIGICLITGKLTYDDLDKMVKKEKERKAKKRKSSSFSYPSPLNEMFWP
ncbi:MAG: hypothetical protein ACI3ZV_06560 [Paludibacteraceae bacterium]